MTLDEAIKHCEEVAEEKESICNVIENKGETWTDSGKNYYDICKKCASEHRQLAEWLKELKKWRALRDSINMLCDVDCEYPQYRESGTMCNACPIGTVKEYFEQIFEKE